jgi:3-deoxy-manno-octulosonate cytidylyltransferase (CMP-KDO synthetase)
MKIIGIIPARYRSLRFEGKPLIDLCGKTMIARTYEQVSKVKLFDRVVVATDDRRIYNEIVAVGGKPVLTSPSHRSGTDRCLEALQQLNYNPNETLVINIQGDEPFIQPLQIEELIHCFDTEDIQIATLIKRIESEENLHNLNMVKVVVSDKQKALYFSRYAIPYLRNISFEDSCFYKHIGMYAYRGNILQELVRLPVSSLEQAESLEQLRWLQAGYEIVTHLTQYETGIAIDTPEDREKAIQYIQTQNL